MAVMRHSAIAREYYSKNRASGGAKLPVPKTPVEKIMLRAKLLKMKVDYLERQAKRGG